MENDAHYTLVGSIVIAISLALAAGFVWLMGGMDSVSYQHYTIYFHNESMDGLDINSPVKLRGIKVGEVTSYAFVTGQQESVRVNIKLDQTTPIHVDSRAYIKRNIITSIAAIEINNPHAHSPLLPTTTSNGQYPIIAEGNSDLDKVATILSQVAQNGAQVLNKINLVLSDKNRTAVSKTLQNIQTISAQLVEHKQDFNDTLRSVKAAADTINHTASGLDQTSTDLDQDMRKFSSHANVTFGKADAALDNLQQQSVIISQQVQTLTNTANYQLNQISHDLHKTANTITSTGQQLTNPRALIFNSGKPETAPGE